MDTDGNTLALCKIVAVHRAANNAAREPAVLQRFPSISIQPRPCLLGGRRTAGEASVLEGKGGKKGKGHERRASLICKIIKGDTAMRVSPFIIVRLAAHVSRKSICLRRADNRVGQELPGFHPEFLQNQLPRYDNGNRMLHFSVE